MILILPYTEQQGLYDLFDLSVPITEGVRNAQARGRSLGVMLLCPFDGTPFQWNWAYGLSRHWLGAGQLRGQRRHGLDAASRARVLWLVSVRCGRFWMGMGDRHDAWRHERRQFHRH